MTGEYESLPPTQYLIMEVLASRARLGERYWTFPTRLRPALNSLEERGWIWVRAAPTPDLQAWLTDSGRSVALYDGYVNPVDRAGAKLAAVREWADALVGRSTAPVAPSEAAVRSAISLRAELIEILDQL